MSLIVGHQLHNGHERGGRNVSLIVGHQLHNGHERGEVEI